MRRSIVASLLAVLLLLGGPLDAHANPRVTGHIKRIRGNSLVLVRSSGQVVTAVLQRGATIKRDGKTASLSQFHVGDVVVVEVAGALNDDPLECEGLYDFRTAGVAPRVVGGGTPYNQGGIALPGHINVPAPSDLGVTGMIGGNENMTTAPPVTVYKPTRPWENEPTQAGATFKLPEYQKPSPTEAVMVAPGATTGSETGTAPAPVVPNATPSNFPPPARGNVPMTAAPAPSQNPFIAEAIGANNGAPPQPPSPVVMPSIGGNLISLQGTVIQVVAAQHLFVMQAQVGGRAETVQVKVPPQIGIISASNQRVLTLDRIQSGNYVMLTGVQVAAGAVEARKLYVNQ